MATQYVGARAPQRGWSNVGRAERMISVGAGQHDPAQKAEKLERQGKGERAARAPDQPAAQPAAVSRLEIA